MADVKCFRLEVNKKGYLGVNFVPPAPSKRNRSDVAWGTRGRIRRNCRVQTEREAEIFLNSHFEKEKINPTWHLDKINPPRQLVKISSSCNQYSTHVEV